MVKTTLAAIAGLSLLACGGGGDDDVDAGVVDARDIDATLPACATPSVPSSLGATDTAPWSAIVDDRGVPGGPVVMRITARIDRSAPPNPKDDVISIRLFEGFTVFDPELVTGSFELTGAETNFYTCGACVHLLGDYDPGTDEVAQNFVVDSGTLTITEISKTAGLMVTGTITNAHFRQVTLDDEATTQLVVPGGCETTAAEIAFTAPIQVL